MRLQGFTDACSLREHGESLLHRKARAWQARVTLLMVFVALFEAAVWASLTAVLTTELPLPVRIAVSGFAAVFAAAVTWVIEASLATLDLEAARERSVDSPGENWRDVFVRLWLKIKIGQPFLIRLALLVAIVGATKPALVQLTFNKEIERRYAQALASVYEGRQANLQQHFGTEQKRLQAQADSLRNLKILETAGRGVSGMPRCGSTCRAIGEQIQSVEARLVRLDTLQSEALKRVDSAHVAALTDGISLPERQRIAQEIVEGPSGKHVMYILHAVLLMLYGSLLVLKLFQPSEAAWYYWGRLQASFRKYEKGELDRFLLLEELESKQNAMPMEVQEFHEWCTAYYWPRLAEERLNDELRSTYSSSIGRRRTLEEERRQVESTVELLDQDFARMEQERAALVVESAEIEAQQQQRADRVTKARDLLTHGSVDLEDGSHLLALRELARAEIVQLTAASARAQVRREAVLRRIERLDALQRRFSEERTALLNGHSLVSEHIAELMRSCWSVLHGEGTFSPGERNSDDDQPPLRNVG